MIRLDISSLIFFYTLFSVILILGVWTVFAYKARKKLPPRDVDYIWKCSVCSHIYVYSKHEDMSACPLCGSYNKRENFREVTE